MNIIIMVYILYLSISLTICGYIIKNWIPSVNAKFIPYILLVKSIIIMVGIVFIIIPDSYWLVKLGYIFCGAFLSSTSASGIYQFIKLVRKTICCYMFTKYRKRRNNILHEQNGNITIKHIDTDIFTISISDTIPNK